MKDFTKNEILQAVLGISAGLVLVFVVVVFFLPAVFHYNQKVSDWFEEPKEQERGRFEEPEVQKIGGWFKRPEVQETERGIVDFHYALMLSKDCQSLNVPFSYENVDNITFKNLRAFCEVGGLSDEEVLKIYHNWVSENQLRNDIKIRINYSQNLQEGKNFNFHGQGIKCFKDDTGIRCTDENGRIIVQYIDDQCIQKECTKCK